MAGADGQELNRALLVKRAFGDEPEDAYALDLSALRLTDPSPVGSCGQLVVLSLRSNLIVKLPAALFGLTRLRKLDVSHNSLRTIPSRNWWRQLPELQVLHLHNNPLKSLRNVASLSALPSLLRLSLHGCPVSEHAHYRHLLANTCVTLCALDRHVVTDDELVEGAAASSGGGARFCRLGARALLLDANWLQRFRGEPLSAAEFQSQLGAELAYVRALHASESAVLQLQRLARGLVGRVRARAWRRAAHAAAVALQRQARGKAARSLARRLASERAAARRAAAAAARRAAALEAARTAAQTHGAPARKPAPPPALAAPIATPYVYVQARFLNEVRQMLAEAAAAARLAGARALGGGGEGEGGAMGGGAGATAAAAFGHLEEPTDLWAARDVESDELLAAHALQPPTGGLVLLRASGRPTRPRAEAAAALGVQGASGRVAAAFGDGAPAALAAAAAAAAAAAQPAGALALSAADAAALRLLGSRGGARASKSEARHLRAALRREPAGRSAARLAATYPGRQLVRIVVRSARQARALLLLAQVHNDVVADAAAELYDEAHAPPPPPLASLIGLTPARLAAERALAAAAAAAAEATRARFRQLVGSLIAPLLGETLEQVAGAVRLQASARGRAVRRALPLPSPRAGTAAAAASAAAGWLSWRPRTLAAASLEARAARLLQRGWRALLLRARLAALAAASAAASAVSHNVLFGFEAALSLVDSLHAWRADGAAGAPRGALRADGRRAALPGRAAFPEHRVAYAFGAEPRAELLLVPPLATPLAAAADGGAAPAAVAPAPRGLPEWLVARTGAHPARGVSAADASAALAAGRLAEPPCALPSALLRVGVRVGDSDGARAALGASGAVGARAAAGPLRVLSLSFLSTKEAKLRTALLTLALFPLTRRGQAFKPPLLSAEAMAATLAAMALQARRRGQLGRRAARARAHADAAARRAVARAAAADASAADAALAALCAARDPRRADDGSGGSDDEADGTGGGGGGGGGGQSLLAFGRLHYRVHALALGETRARAHADAPACGLDAAEAAVLMGAQADALGLRGFRPHRLAETADAHALHAKRALAARARAEAALGAQLAADARAAELDAALAARARAPRTAAHSHGLQLLARARRFVASRALDEATGAADEAAAIAAERAAHTRALVALRRDFAARAAQEAAEDEAAEAGRRTALARADREQLAEGAARAKAVERAEVGVAIATARVHARRADAARAEAHFEGAFIGAHNSVARRLRIADAQRAKERLSAQTARETEGRRFELAQAQLRRHADALEAFNVRRRANGDSRRAVRSALASAESAASYELEVGLQLRQRQALALRQLRRGAGAATLDGGVGLGSLGWSVGSSIGQPLLPQLMRPAQRAGSAGAPSAHAPRASFEATASGRRGSAQHAAAQQVAATFIPTVAPLREHTPRALTLHATSGRQ